MTFKEIQELVRIFSKAGIGELSVEQDNFKIKLKSIEGTVKMVPQMAAPMMAPQVISAAPVNNAVETSTAEAPAKSNDSKSPSGNQIVIKAPMIGTFYRSGGPDKEPFVKVGDRIEPGQSICIIEAMKLFNEIESEVSGTIVKVLVNDSTPVEYDQPLFIIEP
jgi:acetyl-CoA carboxylase biotin carboxyl carrier protein